MFLTDQGDPIHATGFESVLRRTVISDGTRFHTERIGAAEHDVLAGRLEIVVLDQIGARCRSSRRSPASPPRST